MASKLVEYGILNEESDYRIHVCPKARRIYIFRTLDFVNIPDKDRKFRKVPAFQKGVKTPTSEGYLVPPKEIPRCEEVKIVPYYLDAIQFNKDDDTTTKGWKAVDLVIAMIEGGPMGDLIEAKVVVTSRIEDQMKGIDILIEKRSTIQVKCDYDGGGKRPECTGNLFIQLRESNPLGKH